MASFITIDQAMRVEVATRLKDLVPNRQKSSASGRFTEYDKKLSKTTPITEFQGKSRVFWIGPPTEVNPHFGVGSGAVDRTYEYPIIIVYEYGDLWNSILMDDVESIRSSLLNSTDGDVTGVCARFVHWESRAEVTKHDDDPWQYVTLPLWCVFRIS